MSDPPEIHKDIQIHIHEHVGPLRERVGRLEGWKEYTDRELQGLKASIESLEVTVEDIKNQILDKFSSHEVGEWQRYDTIQNKVIELRNWLLGIAGGLSAAWVLYEFVSKIHGGGT
jgi:hypothetical protein